MTIHSLLSLAKSPPPASAAPPPVASDWANMPGIYFKMPISTLDSYGSGNTNSVPKLHFPSNYLTNYGANNFPLSIYWKLLQYKWLRGIQIDLLWGDVEISPGVYDWTKYDNIVSIVEGIGTKGLNGQNKKILFLLSASKCFSIDEASRIMPAHYLEEDVGNPYSTAASGPLYVGTPPSHTFIDMPRYHNLWGYDSPDPQPSNPGFGYHNRSADFRNGLTGNNRAGDPIYTIRNAELAFITAFYSRYMNSPVFGGVISVEPSPTSPIDTTTLIGGKPEFVDTDHYNGRLQRLKDIKAIITDHLVIEAGTHSNTWQVKMTAAEGTPGADGCIVNKLGFTGPNFHTGTGLRGIHNARRNLTGKVPIVIQCQGQDMRSMSGNFAKFWTWTYTPPVYSGIAAAGIDQGQPLTENFSDGVINNDPITTGDWVMQRTWYFRANMLIYQYLQVASNPDFDVDAFSAYMEGTPLTTPNPIGGSIKNDPHGGLSITEPTYWT